jgi:HPr kinase/phosphorylase
MRLHASCAARLGPHGLFEGVLLCGPSGSGKSDLLLRLIQRGFLLVADDQVNVTDGMASAPVALAGILEVRGLGLFRLHFAPSAPLRLVVNMGVLVERLPVPRRDARLDLPAITIDPALASAPERVILALDTVGGWTKNIVGAFAA